MMKHYKLSDLSFTILNIVDDKDYNPQMTHLDYIYGMSDNLYSKEPNMDAEIPKLNVFRCDKKPKDIMQLIVMGYVFNDKAMNLLSAINLPEHSLYPLQYIHKKNWYETNYLVMEKRLEDYIDYQKTTFVYKINKEDSYIPIPIVDHADYLEKVKQMKYLECRELILTDEGYNIDLFYSFIFCDFICTEKFRKIYHDLKLSGLTFFEISEFMIY